MVDSGDRDVEIWEEGAKAEASTEAILPVSHEAAMLSGKSGESRMKTSEVERRPRVRALESSSVLRRGPSESALPVVVVPGSARWSLGEDVFCRDRLRCERRGYILYRCSNTES